MGTNGLEKILEKMEFTEGTEFEKQKSINTDEGKKIPDVLFIFQVFQVIEEIL